MARIIGAGASVIGTAKLAEEVSQMSLTSLIRSGRTWSYRPEGDYG